MKPCGTGVMSITPEPAVTPAISASDVTVRPATDADLGSVVALLEHGSLVEGKEDPSDLAPYREALADLDGQPGGVLVADVGGRVVGVCQLTVFRHLQSRGGLCAEIESVHVHPDRRGCGIGHVLMEAAIRWARELGCYRVQLTSNVARPDAHRFYESLGFTPSHQGFKLALA
jgi:GNAT superfamily N-acetyltransferase